MYILGLIGLIGEGGAGNIEKSLISSQSASLTV